MSLYLAIAIAFLIFFYIYQRNIQRLLKIALSILLLVLCYFTYEIIWGLPTFMAEEKAWFETAPWKHIILFVAMLLGMVTDYLYLYLKARIAARESSGEMPKFIWENLWIRFLLSVLVFGFFWGHYSNEPMNCQVVFISYQNGFFWKKVLK
ncbi:hypothetical protein L0Z72_07065 [candidate division KSB1 bacterium]|nr:hypothetical protein [candidate division KSB1 bacterium]